MGKLSELTRDELRDLCRNQKLQVQGSKADLVERLLNKVAPKKQKLKAKKATVKKAKPAKKAAKPKSKTKYKALGHDLKVTPIKKILRDRAKNADGVKSQETKDYLKRVRAERKAREES